MSVTITAGDVNKLRQITGAGMMDCKKALGETGGDFEAAIDYLRKKGQKVSEKRADRETNEGVVIAVINNDGSFGTIMGLGCETDFVAKNQAYIDFAKSISDVAMANKAESKEALMAMTMDGITIAEKIAEQVGKIGEKIDITA